MNAPRQSSRHAFVDVLQALTSASWQNVKIIADLNRQKQKKQEEIGNLFLRAICSIRDEAEFSDNLALLADYYISAAFELSIAGAHLSLCSQFICINQDDRARREALAFVQYAIAAGHSIGFTLSDSEKEMVLEKISSMPARIESQQSLSLATTLGHLPRKMLFVLGMHRSGTSALAGMLRDIGLDVPIDLMPPTNDNPKGYIESIGIMTENEKFISALGTSWRFDKPLPRGWTDLQSADQWRKALLCRLRESFDGVSYPVVKDPRFCVLLAGLSCWMQACVIDFRFVLLVRHPLEVVNSLLARPNDPISKVISLQLWIESVLSSERTTRGMRRMVVIASDLFESPVFIQSELQDFIEPDAIKCNYGEFSSFVEPELRHHRCSGNMQRQLAWGMNRCEVLEDLAIKIYDEIKINRMSLRKEKIDELYNLWMHVA